MITVLYSPFRIEFRRITIGMATIVMLAIGIGLIAYTATPHTIASHWNIYGEADRYASRSSIFLIPAFMLALFVSWRFLPEFPSYKKVIAPFNDTYDAFFLALLLFFLYLLITVSAWNVGFVFSFTRFLAPAAAFLFASIGILLPRIQRNSFIGVRTPWTLTSDSVWQKTHMCTSFLFILSSFVMLAGILFPAYFAFFILIPILASVAASVSYSYLEFRKENKF